VSRSPNNLVLLVTRCGCMRWFEPESSQDKDFIRIALFPDPPSGVFCKEWEPSEVLKVKYRQFRFDHLQGRYPKEYPVYLEELE